MSIRNPNKKIRIDGEAEEHHIGVDRLSSLPDHILQSVLSFLDCTKRSVQTSVLSRRWRSLWKQVPILTLRTKHFTPSSFARYVGEVLSRRPENCNIDVIYYAHLDFSIDKELFHRVVKFAASHSCQELVCVPYDDEALDSYLFFPFENSNLRTLRIRRAALESGFGSCGFSMLTILELEECSLPCDTAADLDPFANFPCLKDLILSCCGFEDDQCCFNINGPQLVKLLVYEFDCSKLEIFAPKLKFFDYLVYSKITSLFNLRLPSLDHADISVVRRCHDERNMEEMKACYISLLQGLHNASSLFMNDSLFEELGEV
ncbi:unnamed protein product [Linum tenue]|uniref:F-box domain-containing protein n=1 Tax=Linum tenue TaxID=586396 RepID=A0AAV0Q430_9ROSI|nr:unnamed protein product [Linum tenue]